MKRIKGAHGGPRPGSGRKRSHPRFEQLAPWALYVIREVDGGEQFCKIGITSRDVNARLSDLQVGNPRILALASQVGLSTRIDAIFSEIAVHRRLLDRKVNGEWFRISAEEAVLVVADVLSEIKVTTVPVSQRSIFEEAG